MKFTLGDAIYLRQTDEEGIITAFLSATIYEVEAGGVRFPVFAEEVEHPYLRRFQLKREVKAATELPLPVPEKSKPPRLPHGCYLSFMAQYGEQEAHEEIIAVKLMLVNELPDTLRFSYELFTAQNQSLFSLNGLIPQYANLYLHTISWEQFAAQPRFGWSLQPSYEGRYGPLQKGTLTLKPKQLVQRLKHFEATGNSMFSELLVDHFVTEITPLPLPVIQSIETVIKGPSTASSFSGTIDLHASAFLPNPEDYMPTEIFRLQLERLNDFIQKAVLHHCRHLVIIHGVGNGVLRRAVNEILKSRREVKRIAHDWHPRYGFGATQVTMHKF